MSRVIAEGITTWPAEPVQLVGSRCGSCNHSTFPAQQWCPNCSGSDMAEVHFPRSGTLVSWTTQGFHPGVGYVTDAAGFEPFLMALVQLGDEIRVEARLTETDPANVEFDMPLELTMIPVGADPDGTEILTFAFAPA